MPVPLRDHQVAGTVPGCPDPDRLGSSGPDRLGSSGSRRHHPTKTPAGTRWLGPYGAGHQLPSNCKRLEHIQDGSARPQVRFGVAKGQVATRPAASWQSSRCAHTTAAGVLETDQPSHPLPHVHPPIDLPRTSAAASPDRSTPSGSATGHGGGFTDRRITENPVDVRGYRS